MASDLRLASPRRRCHHALDAVSADPFGLRYHRVQDGAEATTVARAMGSDRRYVSGICTDSGRWSTATTGSRVPGGDLVDPSHGCPLERFTKVLPFTSYLLAKVEG